MSPNTSFDDTSSLFLHSLFTCRPLSLEINESGFLFLSSDQQQLLLSAQPKPNSLCKVQLKNGRPYLTQCHPKKPLIINGMEFDVSPIETGDWVQVGKQYFYCSETFDHTEATITVNSRNTAWIRQLKKVPALAQSSEPLLILGPSGTGKDVLANVIHGLSPCRGKDLTALNCGAISESIVGSELFGHRKGSFTGAISDRQGAFEMARRSTLFLDEIGDLPPNLQPQLLRALENKQIRPLGADVCISTDVRLISATHQAIHQLVSRKKFREDLYYRLNVLKLNVPPLVHRKEDFDGLLYHFCKTHKVSIGFQAIELLRKHRWPGNIRELRNMVTRASALFPGEQIREAHLYELIENFNPRCQLHKMSHRAVENEFPKSGRMNDSINSIKKRIIEESLIENFGNQRKTARSLGMAKSTLHDKIKTYEIDLRVLREIAIARYTN